MLSRCLPKFYPAAIAVIKFTGIKRRISLINSQAAHLETRDQIRLEIRRWKFVRLETHALACSLLTDPRRPRVQLNCSGAPRELRVVKVRQLNLPEFNNN